LVRYLKFKNTQYLLIFFTKLYALKYLDITIL